MTENSKLMIAVAPNGARKSKSDHPALPITPQEMAETAATCLEAGAAMLHLHVRDDAGGHSLDVDRYRASTQAVRAAVGDNLIIQITTEAVGIYQPQQQRELVRQLRPEAVSLALRELCPQGYDEKTAADFFSWVDRERIIPQYILYTVADVLQFSDMRQRGIIPGANPSVLLVLGKYNNATQSRASDLLPLLRAFKNDHSLNWWICAFGASESQCMLTAAGLGGHCRVGFENNTLLENGEEAASNGALVAQIAGNAHLVGRTPATAEEARSLLTSGSAAR